MPIKSAGIHDVLEEASGFIGYLLHCSGSQENMVVNSDMSTYSEERKCLDTMYLKQLVHSDYCYTLCHFLLHFLSLYNQKLIMWGIQKRVVKYFTVEKSSFILKTCVITSHKIIS